MVEDYLTLFEKGKNAIKKNAYKDAIRFFDSIIALQPKYKEAYNEKGLCLLTLNDVEEAIRYFTFATIIDHDYVEAWLNRETAEILLGNTEQALKCTDEILRIQPDNREIWLKKARTLMKIDRTFDAVECLSRVVELAPEGIDKLTVDEKKLLEKYRSYIKKEKLTLAKKICLLGDPTVGKTSLVRRFVYELFDDRYLATIGAKVTKKVIILSRKGRLDIEISLLLWDIAGDESFGEIRTIYYSGAGGAVIVSDNSNKKSVDNIPKWIESLYNITKKIPIVCVGNKNDLTPNFDEEPLRGLAEKFDTKYFLTSARTGENVEKMFEYLCERLVEGL